MTDYEKLSVNISPKTAATFRWLRDYRGISLTQQVARAIELYKLVTDQLELGGTLAIKNANGKYVDYEYDE